MIFDIIPFVYPELRIGVLNDTTNLQINDFFGNIWNIFHLPLSSVLNQFLVSKETIVLRRSASGSLLIINGKFIEELRPYLVTMRRGRADTLQRSSGFHNSLRQILYL